MISDPKQPMAANTAGLEEADPAPETRNQPPPPTLRRRSAAQIWLRRIGVLLFVFLCATVGVMLIMLPWRPEWTENHLLAAYPALQAVFGSGLVRGFCTGLGFLNVWIGFLEALRYRED